MRRFDDYQTLRQSIFDRTMRAVMKRYPLSNERYTLMLTNVRYDKPKDFSLREQKQALLTGGSLHWRLKGTWRLVDKQTGQVIDERESVVAHVPYITNRGSFIYNGNEYTIAHQMRLRPGVYVRRQSNGELQAQFNVKPGTGRGFNIQFSPENNTFHMKVGQAKIPLYPLLNQLGIPDKHLERAWGKSLLNINRQVNDSQALTKAYRRLVGGKADNPDDQRKELLDYFGKMGLDDEVVSRNIGGFLD